MLNLSGSFIGPPFALPSGFLPCGEVRLVPGSGERNCQNSATWRTTPDAPTYEKHAGTAIADRKLQPTPPLTCGTEAALNPQAARAVALRARRGRPRGQPAKTGWDVNVPPLV